MRRFRERIIHTHKSHHSGVPPRQICQLSRPVLCSPSRIRKVIIGDDLRRSSITKSLHGQEKCTNVLTPTSSNSDKARHVELGARNPPNAHDVEESLGEDEVGTSC